MAAFNFKLRQYAGSINDKGESDLSIGSRSRAASLIVVSNRLPLTLQKTEEGWTTSKSSGGLASAMDPLLRQNGGDWIGWAGDDGGEDVGRTRARSLRSGHKKIAISRSTSQKMSPLDSTRAMQIKHSGLCFTTFHRN